MKKLLLALLATATPLAAQDYRQRLPQDEVIYFVLPDRFENGDTANDRGGLRGGPLTTGFDPTHKGFYHGGDLKGLTRRFDYIQGLGATAIWLGPIFKNKAVQGAKGRESAGYHGYWITDFTTVDPHLGSEADLHAFVDAAHARGMKVYMDIIVNHTADVIQYRECAEGSPCPYRDRATWPYQRRGGVKGAAINSGFVGDDVQTTANFAKLTDPTYAYTPYIPAGEKNAKTPAWLNDPIYYHNRGNTTFEDESSTTGDFSGLDDLYTENPRVIAGMIDVYGSWIDRFGIDGYRIDTAKHVNPEFWRSFVPAMLARAKAKGIPNFHIFGEVTAGMDPGYLARWTKIADYPAVLDFAFMNAVIQTVAENKPTRTLASLFEGDVLYAKGEATADILPTFLGNHDHGRFARDVRQANPDASDEEVLKRVELGHAMLLTLRGVPTIYSGDEQGFAGDGNDQDAREDMFASKVASYNDNPLVGTMKTTATDSFVPSHPLYREIATLARLRVANPALTRGRQVVRARGDAPGLFAVSRFDPDTGREFVIAFNTSTKPIAQAVQVETASQRFTAMAGPCAPKAAAPGSLMLELPAFGYAVCAAESR
ncbi:alpha-amylase family glycosyl hydrolase [Sphingomonas sanguinis]|uniref:alpha-amylase family glycosyl hydrolase n=1 Tax=Sphingomonas sp. LC-1 TaxID=3110957 RepID=UPI0021BA9161|nr:alpha-amylase family glycosyl hydrolase [Sphingomonas sp. LC-1]MCT8000724.1 alpha-amylase family glycosyl hydrolase [Sphingomonas sp. LC-1]